LQNHSYKKDDKQIKIPLVADFNIENRGLNGKKWFQIHLPFDIQLEKCFNMPPKTHQGLFPGDILSCIINC